MSVKNKPLVSVIVPVYNIEKYLAECLDSIISQTYKNIEIILVDDGSTDDSLKIAKKYAKNDERIKIIKHSKNKGLFKARVTGFDRSTGNYFTTVDSDDYIEKNYIDQFMQEADKSNSDIIFSKGFIFSYSDEVRNNLVVTPDGANKHIGRDFSKYLAELGTGKYPIGWNVCGKFYKKDVYELASKHLKGIDRHLVMAEDILLFSILSFFATSTSTADVTGYYYRQNNEASTKIKNSASLEKNIKDVKYVFSQLRFFLKNFSDYKKRNKSLSNYEEYILSGHYWSKKHYTEEVKVSLTGKDIILCPTPFGTMNGGGERSSYVLWRWLNRYYDIIIALPKNTDNEYINQCKKDGVSYVLCDYAHMTDETDAAVVMLSKIIREYNPAVVFPALYFDAGFIAAAMTNTPCVFLDYGLIGSLVTYCSQDRLYLERITRLLRASNLIVANSFGGVNAVRMVGRNAILAHSYTKRPNVKLKETLKTKIIYPARIDPAQKKQMRLLRVAKALKDKGSDIETIIIGSYEPINLMAKEYYNKIIRYIKENDLSDVVKMKGWINNPWKEFGVNDIYVTTTEYEAVGRATLEAVELGIPILIPDIPGHREFRELLKMSDDNFYQPGNIEELANKIEYLVSNIEQAKKQAITYKERAEKYFSEEQCNKDLLPALKSILNKGNPGASSFLSFYTETVNELNSWRRHAHNLEKEVKYYKDQNESFLSVGRSARLLAGNIKRRIIKK